MGMNKMKIPISVGVFAYNEEKNIGNLLAALLKQRTDKVHIDEIFVISSGSIDKTDSIVEEYSQKDERVILKKQEQRLGKASAINEFLKIAKNCILVIESGDTIPEKFTIECLCYPFRDNMVGMVGAHPIPVNNENTFMGYTTHLLWNLHHLLALKKAKCGELIAFRKIFNNIPNDVAVDEAWIEYEIMKRGYRIVYAPDAIVYNKGSVTIGDFLKQRRRIAFGHLDLYKRTKHTVSSSENQMVLYSIARLFPYLEPKKWLWFLSAFALEGISRFLGFYDYRTRTKKYYIWEISETERSPFTESIGKKVI